MGIIANKEVKILRRKIKEEIDSIKDKELSSKEINLTKEELERILHGLSYFGK